MNDMQKIIEKYFKGEKTIYFQSSDQLNSIEGETYLRYQKDGGIQLWFGGNKPKLDPLEEIKKLKDKIKKEITYQQRIHNKARYTEFLKSSQRDKIRNLILLSEKRVEKMENKVNEIIKDNHLLIST